jgi:hypothetical protein
MRCTKAQVNPAPATLVTVIFGDDIPSVAMNASSSSFAEFVENARVLALLDVWVMSLEAVASIAIEAEVGAGKLTMK